MKKFLSYIIAVVGILAIFTVLYGVSGVIVWGVGKFVIDVFEVNYKWGYLHGLATALILSVVGGYFKSSSSNK